MKKSLAPPLRATSCGQETCAERRIELVETTQSAVFLAAWIVFPDMVVFLIAVELISSFPLLTYYRGCAWINIIDGRWAGRKQFASIILSQRPGRTIFMTLRLCSLRGVKGEY
ncbi:MAG: hypothetical protein U9Q77_12655 [Candidatus Marinimicrobia bacterium]|nr:hypothetical protein [Candidatus Neomarinimicrobiota bacterium]